MKCIVTNEVIEEISYLPALNTSSNIEPVDKLLEDGGKWSDTNSTTNKNSDFVAEPILMTFSKWTVDEELREGLTAQVDWVVVLTEVERPGSNGSDVETEVLLVRSRGDGERVELSWILSSAGNLQPLSSFVVKRDGPLEVDTDHLRRQDIRTYDSDLVLPTRNADKQINGIDDSWSQEEVAEQRILHKTSRSVEE